MTDAAWAAGMAALLSSLPDRDLSKDMAAVRAECYRRDLKHLTDSQWDYAVRETLRNCRWFPTIADLLEFAADAPQEAVAVALLPEGTAPTPEQFKEGWEMFKATMRKTYGIDVDSDLKNKTS